jgi:predicted AAA+ superfamily ATPase
MIKRELEKKLKEYSNTFPVILINGPRQSGKTTLSQRVFKNKPYVLLETPDLLSYAQTDPRGFLNDYPEGAILDEIQKAPELMSYIMGIVDKRKKAGLYILTGSQNVLLLKTVKQSLAGRVGVLDLLPLSIYELPIKSRKDYQNLIFNGGYPKIWSESLNPTDTLRSYNRTYLDRDIKDIIDVKNLTIFQAFLKACASRVGTVLNLSSIGNDTGVSHTTIKEWLSVLQVTNAVYLLPSYSDNRNKMLIKTPRIYFYDTGLACYLLGILSKQVLSRDPLYGKLFENLVITEVLKYFYNQGLDAPVSFYREKNGYEIDLIIEVNRELILVEIKSSMTFGTDWTENLETFDSRTKKPIKGRFIVYGGEDAHTVRKVKILPLRELRQIFN